MARIEASKLPVALKVEPKTVAPLAAPLAAALQREPAAKPAPNGSGFDVARKKPMSVSGRYKAQTVDVSDRADLKDLIAGKRLSDQANGNALSRAFDGPAPKGGAVSELFAQIEGNQMQAQGAAPKPGQKAPAATAEEVAKKFTGLDAAATTAELGKLSKPELAALKAGITSGKVTDVKLTLAVLDTVGPAEQSKILKGIPKASLDGLKAAVRAGTTGKDDKIAIAVGIEVAAQTAWGKANPKVVETLRANGKNITADLAAGLGATDSGKIQLKPILLKSPEALAAILAHEGTHLQQGKGASGVDGEVKGNVAQAEVWNEIGNRSDPAVPDNTDQLNAYGDAMKAGGALAVKERLVGKYLENAQNHLAEVTADTEKHPKKKRRADNTVEAWTAQVAVYQKEVDAIAAAKAKAAAKVK